MAKLARKTSTLFANAATVDELAQFGSTVANNPSPPTFSQDPDVLQANAAWDEGWQDAIYAGDKAPVLEEWNAVCYVFSWLISYIYEMGIPEWDSGTTYYKNSVVQDNAGLGQFFFSLQDDNLNNTPPVGTSNSFWQYFNPSEYVVGASATLNTVPKVSNTSPGVGPATSVLLTDSAISDNGTNVIIALPLKFPDGTIQSTAAQPAPTQQNNVTGSRTFNQVYQNTGQTPMIVTIYCSSTLGVKQVFCDSSPSPSTGVAGFNGEYGGSISFVVLPGYYYNLAVVSGSDPTIFSWVEWS